MVQHTASKLKTDPLGQIRQDHTQAKQLISQINETPNLKGKQDLVQALLRLLTIHSALEEKLFYPTVHAAAGSRQGTIDGFQEEHRVMDSLIADLNTLEWASDSYESQLEKLCALAQDHMDDEERLLLIYATDLDVDWAHLGLEMNRRRAELEMAMNKAG